MVDPGADYNTGTNTDSSSLAWSSGTEVPDIPGTPAGEARDGRGVDPEPAIVEQSWSVVLGRSIAVLLICIGVAAVIVVVGLLLLKDDPPPSATPARTTTAPATTTDIASTPDQDSRYIAALNEKGVVFRNPDVAVSNGKAVCQSFVAGQSAEQIVADFRAANAEHPEYADNAEAIVGVSVRAYCPQYAKQVATY